MKRAHTSSEGVGSSNDVKAWDANFNYLNFDSDNGVAVYAVAGGKVATTYAGSTNAGGTTGQVLVEHVRNGTSGGAVTCIGQIFRWVLAIR